MWDEDEMEKVWPANEVDHMIHYVMFGKRSRLGG